MIAPYCCQYLSGGECFNWETKNWVDGVQYIDARAKSICEGLQNDLAGGGTTLCPEL